MWSIFKNDDVMTKFMNEPLVGEPIGSQNQRVGLEWFARQSNTLVQRSVRTNLLCGLPVLGSMTIGARSAD